MNGKPNSHRLAALLLFYFQSGLDAGQVVGEGARGNLTFRSPSEEDLERLRRNTPLSLWEAVLPIAEGMVQQIVTTEPRDPLTLGSEVFSTIRRGQDFLRDLAGGKEIRPLHENLGKGSKK